MVLWFRSPPSNALASSANDDVVTPDDVELIAAALADPRAFATLYERYLGPIYRYCYVRLGFREAAEDATSEVFLKALAGLPGYRAGLFAAWLFRIAHNVVIDAQRRRPITVALPDGDEEHADPAATPEDLALARAECQTLRAALAQLPPHQRAAVELKLAGWADVQIGAALGKSPAAVKMLRLRGLAQIRAVLTRTTPSS